MSRTPAPVWVVAGAPGAGKTMLAERLGLDPDAAFDRLRAHAFAQGRLLVDVAVDVLARRLRLD